MRRLIAAGLPWIGRSYKINEALASRTVPVGQNFGTNRINFVCGSDQSGRLLFVFASLPNLNTERTRLAGVERFDETFRNRVVLNVLGEHIDPRHRLQYAPVPARKLQESE